MTTHSARWALRDATRAIHEAAHQLPAFQDLLEGRIDRARYGRLLTAMHRFHASSALVCEEADAALGYDEPGREGAARRALLEEDLRSHGLAAEPGVVRLDADGRPGWNIGFAYVVRGSSLGGAVLHRSLDAVFGEELAGRTFFKGPPGEPARWRIFCDRLDRWGDTTALDDGIAGAEAAFVHFGRCMEGA